MFIGTHFGLSHISILPLQIISTALIVFSLFTGNVQADPFDNYLIGSGQYSCFKPKISKDCGPRPSVLSQTGRYALHALDFATRSINDRSLKDKAILILSPLFAQIPATQALAEAQVSQLKKDVMKSFIVAYYREAKHLPPDVRIKRQKAMIKFLTNYDYNKPAEAKKKFEEAMGGAWALHASFSDLADISLEDLKKARKVYKDFQAAKAKAIEAAESWFGFATKMITMADYIKADHHYVQSKHALNGCKFEQANEKLKNAEKNLREFCRVASHEYRYAEMYADCYGEWYIDYMWGYNKVFDQNPQQTRLKNLHNDLKNNQGSLLNMLKLFGKIDERKEQLQKASSSWEKVTRLANQQKPIFDRALKNADYKTACNIVDHLWGSAKSLPTYLECVGNLGDHLERKWVLPLRRFVYEDSDKIDSILNQAKSRITECKLSEANKFLHQARTKAGNLWEFDESRRCQKISKHDDILQKITSLDEKVRQAKDTVCNKKATPNCRGLVGNWIWFNGASVNCGEGSCTASNGFNASWTCDKATGQYEIRWQKAASKGVWVDKVKVTGNSLSGSNQIGGSISATRK